MNNHDEADSLLHLLASLDPISPSTAVNRRGISRCHASLARRQSRHTAVAPPRPLLARVFDAVLALAIASYGATAALEAVRLAFGH